VTEIVQGLGARERGRIVELRRDGQFFWIDVSLHETTMRELGEALDLPDHALQPLAFTDTHTASRRFYSDAQYVVFAFSCYTESAENPADGLYRSRSLRVQVLVSGDFMLTVHEERLSLPAVLAPNLPSDRSPRYVVFAVLEAMVASAFDALHEIEETLDVLAVGSAGLGGGRVRMATLRATAAHLARMRREAGPQRTLFERVGVEIERLPGLEPDGESYFDHLAGQVDRLVAAIEAASDTMATLVDLRLNETSYWLTVVATIFLPLTFVTGFFGMNFGWMVDRVDTQLAFLLLGVGGCLVSVLLVWRLVVRAMPVDVERAEPSRPAATGGGAPPRGSRAAPPRRR
jgi:magnesium transporter